MGLFLINFFDKIPLSLIIKSDLFIKYPILLVSIINLIEIFLHYSIILFKLYLEVAIKVKLKLQINFF